MTAEIVICNKNGIVLAADSAVTLSDGVNSKIYNTARKVFSIDDHNIGLMTYGNADLNSIPIDLIFKTFAEKVRNGKCDSFDDYTSLFLQHLESMKELKNSLSEKKFIISVIQETMQFITESLDRKIDIVIHEHQSAPHSIVVSLFDESLDEVNEIFREEVNKELFEGIDDYITNHYSQLIQELFKNEFEDYLYETTNWDKIHDLIINIINSPIGINPTGIVICGYGKEDIFPNHFKIEICGVINGVLRIVKEDIYNVDQNENTAAIFPLAQTDVVHTLIHGIDPQLFTFIYDNIERSDTIDEAEMIFKNINQFVKMNYTEPFINIIGSLPLEEVANVAEMMINLTSFKRKFSSAQETVGGPIDVLAISRLDGPIWIKRKHYFDIDKNLAYRLRKGGN